MPSALIDVVVAGHICLDIIPRLSHEQARAEDLFVPGGLLHVGPATLTLGGCVANTGIALYRLGAKTHFVGKVGDDLLGKAILETLRQYDAAIEETMLVAAGEATSYSIVLSPPQVDRGILHCPGTNDTFVAADLARSSWQDARIFHFGYPPLMHRIFADEGQGLAEKFAEVQSAGILVSLDMALPDTSPSGPAINWRQWLRNVLPHVDVFLPSTEEIMLMLGPPSEGPDESSNRPNGNAAELDTARLAELADELLGFGVPIVVIKLGDQGLYLRTSGQTPNLAGRAVWHDFNWQAWRNRELLAPCFDVEVVGTLGSGDCTIAGLLMAILQGSQPDAAIRYATAVGAYCVQSADATSNIPAWSEVENKVLTAWPQRAPTFNLQNWRFCQENAVYVGPADANSIVVGD